MGVVRRTGEVALSTSAASARLSAYDDASRSATDAVRNSADYLRRVRAQRLQEATSQVRAELRRRVPARWGRTDRMWLACAALAAVAAVVALVVSSMGLFA